ncbi:TIGR01244 family sulfur transferase [Arenicella xantha]|uniref:Uncharacterized protein (TIGR01244 family) n=1 Tax=Arenicella xantha TaxID=644221 RepID=A0A395JF67_9GAMM|nr:TIGR01244 family sulfur transferase [Arenicella xantha]RBP48324.1 uncharacterized protein (TIGR01244 family) [Arenicella xantha]
MKHLHKNIFVGGQIQAADFDALAHAGIKVIINNRPDGEEPNQLTAHQARELAAEYGIDYHYLPMANGQPMPDDLVANFKSIIDSNEDPIFAHCRSGMRSSFIWAIGQIEAKNLSADETIESAQAAGIPLGNARAVLESLENSK